MLCPNMNLLKKKRSTDCGMECLPMKHEKFKEKEIAEAQLSSPHDKHDISGKFLNSCMA